MTKESLHMTLYFPLSSTPCLQQATDTTGLKPICLCTLSLQGPFPKCFCWLLPTCSPFKSNFSLPPLQFSYVLFPPCTFSLQAFSAHSDFHQHKSSPSVHLPALQSQCKPPMGRNQASINMGPHHSHSVMPLKVLHH